MSFYHLHCEAQYLDGEARKNTDKTPFRVEAALTLISQMAGYYVFVNKRKISLIFKKTIGKGT